MKVVLVCILGLSQVFAYKFTLEEPSAFNYHEKFGIKAAARLKSAEEARDFDGSRIIGGDLAFAGDVPHMGGLAIILTNGLTSVCASSMLSNTKMLTAAHCWWDGRTQGLTVTVVLGANTLFLGGTRVITNQVTMHPNWDPSTARNDIAIIHTPWVAYTNVIQSVQLPSGSLLNNNFAATWAEAAGFGLLRDEYYPGAYQFLYRVNLQVITNAQCSEHYIGITDDMLCTSGADGKSTCRGDMGGPLAVKNGENNVLIGVASFVSQHGCTVGRHAGFTRVTSYVDWIRSQL